MSLMSKMCYYPNNIYQYHEDVNFDDAVTSFLNEFKSQLPCQNNKIKDQCFGYGLYHSGLYLGEWVNNYPHGKGIALITNNFPVMSRSSMEVNKALYKGILKMVILMVLVIIMIHIINTREVGLMERGMVK